MTPDARFELGCLRKALLAVAALELAERGVIDLDAPISRYLRELAGANADRITARHLLSHTAGYQGENIVDPEVAYDYSYSEFVESFNSRPMLFEPGTVFDYSHSAPILLSRLISAVAGDPTALIRSTTLEPLGIDALDPDGDAKHRVAGHFPDVCTGQPCAIDGVPWCEFWSDSIGGHRMTLKDMVKIGAAITRKSAVFSSGTLGALLSPAVRLPRVHVGKCAEDRFYSFGLGCARYATGIYGLSSSLNGTTLSMRFDVDNDIAIAVGINAHSPYLRDTISKRLFNSLFPEDLAERQELLGPAAEEFDVKELEGAYTGAKHHAFVATAKQGRLTMNMVHDPNVSHEPELVSFAMVKDSAGRLIPATDFVKSSIGFFRGPTGICLSVGINALRKHD